MKYAIASNRKEVGELSGFIRLDDEGAGKTLDPSKATLFSSKKDAKDWLIQNIVDTTCFSLVSEEELKDKSKQFQEFFENGAFFDRLTLIDPTMNVMFDPEKHDVYDVMDWMYRQVTEGTGNEITFDVYYSWQDTRYGDLKGSAFQEFKVYLHDDTEKIRRMVPIFEVTVDFPFKQLEKEVTYLLDKYPSFTTQEGGFDIYMDIDLGNPTLMMERIVFKRLGEEQWQACSSAGKVFYEGTLKECYDGIMDNAVRGVHSIEP